MILKFEQKLIDQLSVLKKKYNLVGIKSETEAEGSSYSDIARIRSITNKLGIKFNKHSSGMKSLRKTASRRCSMVSRGCSGA